MASTCGYCGSDQFYTETGVCGNCSWQGTTCSICNQPSMSDICDSCWSSCPYNCGTPGCDGSCSQTCPYGCGTPGCNGECQADSYWCDHCQSNDHNTEDCPHSYVCGICNSRHEYGNECGNCGFYSGCCQCCTHCSSYPCVCSCFIYYYVDGEEYHPVESYSDGDTYTIKSLPSKTGYTSLKWLTSDGEDYNWTGETNKTWNISWCHNGEFGIEDCGGGHYELHLYATLTPNTYTVNFDTNGGADLIEAVEVTYDSTYGKLATPTRNGYTFAGWYTSANGGTKITSTTTVKITSAQTLYAHWTANKYTVTFSANGGSCSTSTKQVTYNSTYETLPVPTRGGYEFIGWYTEVEAGTKVESTTVVCIYQDHSLHAHWKAIEYTVTYHANGGTISNNWSNPAKVTYGSNFTVIPSTDITKENYRFVGWTSNADGSYDNFNWTDWSDEWDGYYGYWEAIKQDNTVDLYAMWEPLATIFTKVNGAYVAGSPYIKTSAGWKKGLAVYVKVNGDWKPSTR